MGLSFLPTMMNMYELAEGCAILLGGTGCLSGRSALRSGGRLGVGDAECSQRIDITSGISDLAK
jgi:hypothetical protein